MRLIPICLISFITLIPIAFPAVAQSPVPATTQSEALQRGRELLAVGRYWEASEIAKRILATTPDDAEASLLLVESKQGLERIQQEKLQQADALVARGELTDEQRRDAANVYFSAGRYDTAARLYASLPDALRDRETRLRHARSLAWTSRLDEAELLYRALLEEPQTDRALDLEYGRLLSWLGASVAARERLESVYAATGSDEAVIALANARAWGGDRAGALELLDSHLRAHPGAADAVTLRNEIASSGELQLERVNRLIEAEPYNLALRLERARLLIATAKYGRALDDLRFVEEHSERAGDEVAALRREANAKQQEAIAGLSARLADLDARSADDADEIHELAKAYVGADSYGEAVNLYDRYLELRPDDLEARIEYARVLGWNGRYAASAQQYERITRAAPDRLDLQLEYARILSYDERYVPARRRFEALTDVSDRPRADLYPQVPVEARYHLGQIYRWFGWNEHALAEQSGAIDLDASYQPSLREIDLIRHNRPATTFDARYTHAENSNDFTLDRVDLEAERWTSPRTAWQLLVGRHSFGHRSDEVDSTAVGAGARYRWSDQWITSGRVGANFYGEDLGTSPYWGLGTQWLPSLQSRVAFDYSHYDLVYDVFTVDSLRSDPLDIDDFRVHYDHATGGRWSWIADASKGFISDGNDRTALHGLLSFRLLKAPYVAVKGDYRYLSYDFRSNRYWSPGSYNSYAGVLHVGDDIRQRFYWQVELKYGRSDEGTHSSDLRALEARATVPVNDAIDLVGAYADGRSGRLEAFPGGGDDFTNYWQRRFYVGIRLKRLFNRDDRTGSRPYYYDERPLGESSLVPPEVR